MKLKVEIITPTNVVFKDEADEITVPTATGEITILPEHVSLVSQIAPGELVIKNGTNTEDIAITGGFLEVANNVVSILADYAIRDDDISAIKAEEAKKHAEKAMRERLSQRDFALAEGELRRALLELKIVAKRKAQRHPSETSS